MSLFRQIINLPNGWDTYHLLNIRTTIDHNTGATAIARSPQRQLFYNNEERWEVHNNYIQNILQILFAPITVDKLYLYLERFPSILTYDAAGIPDNVSSHRVAEKTFEHPSIIFGQVTRNINNTFDRMDSAFEDIKKLSMFLQEDRFHKIRCYNVGTEECPKYYILSTKATLNILHKIISLVPKLYPHLFADVDPAIVEMYKKLADPKYNNLDPLWDYYTDIIQEKDLIELKREIHSMKNKAIENVKYRIELIEKDIQASESRLRDLFKSHQKDNTMLLGLEYSDEEQYKAFTAFLIEHSYLSYREKLSSGVYAFTCKAPVKYFDGDAIKTYQNTVLRRYSKTFKQLTLKTFVENKYELWFETNFYVNFNDSRVGKLHGYNGTANYVTHYPMTNNGNPHIYLYNCWGNNSSNITKALAYNNLIEAFEIATAACCNLNFDDITVTKDFFSYLESGHYKAPMFYNKETKQMLTYEQAMEEIANEAN